MKIILFKSGDKIKIDDDVADKIATRILSNSGAKQWQLSYSSNTKESLINMINLEEVAAIYNLSHIM